MRDDSSKAAHLPTKRLHQSGRMTEVLQPGSGDNQEGPSHLVVPQVSPEDDIASVANQIDDIKLQSG